MKKFILFLLLFSNTSFASNYRSQMKWTQAFCDAKCCYNTREYLLIKEGHNVQINSKCQIKNGVWYSFYTNKELNDKKIIDIDHVLPFSWIYKHGVNNLSLDKQLAIYNDFDNLRISHRSENRKKKDLLDLPFNVSNEKTAEYKQIQCHVCNKHKLQACNEVC